MLNRILLSAILFLLGGIFLPVNLSAQCGAGYTQAQVNWDNLDYYWNSGSSSTGPYQTYISNTQEQNQRFAIGSNYVTIVTNSNALVNPGSGNSAENASHTGDLSGYTGEDVQYNPSADGQYITLIFKTEVTNLNFTLYDIDRSQRIDVDAWNAANTGQNVNIATQASTILTVSNNNTTNAYVTASSSSLTNNSNQGSATITVNGPVDSVRITVTTRGSDVVFWLSDINACVTGSFPTNYHRTGNNEPMVGPTMNQPDYFILTPDNQSTYMVDPATGAARLLFTDVSEPYVNSFGYDPYNHILYYVTDYSSSSQNNKTLKKYDFNTETMSTVIADIGTTLGIPTFDQGIESAAASFYDGALYIGIEGGRYSSGSSTRTRETIIWRIEFDGSLNPTVAYQVFAADAYINSSNTSIHDYGDFIIKDGILYDFNTARNGSNYSQSKFHHYNLMTGNLDALYTNPGSSAWNGQAAMGWSNQLYYFRATSGGNSGIGTYDGSGNCGSTTDIYVADGSPAWPGGAGDASENFRPKCDFGDAPASYDPVANSPAVHERSDSIRLGATWDSEWIKKGVTSSDDTDDGLPYASFLPPGNSIYYVEATVYNNSGANARVIAWLDYNDNGVFDASEAISPISVPSSSSPQTIALFWPSITNSFINGDSTYLRIRITEESAGMTSAHATGYFAKGEVEDYKVYIDNFPLATSLLDFSAVLNAGKVKLNWSVSEEISTYGYQVERSKDNMNWVSIFSTSSNGNTGIKQYQTEDQNPLPGISYYRIRIIESTGMNRFSDIKKITNTKLSSQIVLMPNPASNYVVLKVESSWTGFAQVQVVDISGRVAFSSNEKIQNGSNQIKLNLPESIQNGTYIIKLIAKDEVINEKLIIKK